MELEKRTFDFELLTEDKIKEIINMGQAELNKRERKRREVLITAFIKAWKDLEDDGATIFFKESYMLEKIDLNDLEIE